MPASREILGRLFLRSQAAPSVSAAGQAVIYYDSATDTVKISVNGGAYITLSDGTAAQIDGSGTAGKLSKFSDTNTLTDSLVSESGSNVTVNGVLLPNAAGTRDLGSATLPFATLKLAGTSGTPGTNNFSITGASTSGTRTITLPDSDTKVPIAAQFLTFSGPTAARTFTLPDAAATVLTSNAAVTVAQGGTGVATLASNGVLYGNGTGVVQVTAQGAANSVLTANAGAPAFSDSPTLVALTTTGAITAGASSLFGWTGRSTLGSSADGIATFSNNAGTGFTRLNLGGTTSSFPALVVTGTTLDCKLADDSAFAPFRCGAFTTNGAITATSGSITIASAGAYFFLSRSRFVSSADGLISLQNNAGSGFTRLNWGGATTSFAGIGSSSTTLTVQLGDGSAGGTLALSGATANSFLYSGTSGALTTTSAPTNGQLLIGSTGAAPVAAALTAGTGITVTNGAGSVTVASANLLAEQSSDQEVTDTTLTNSTGLSLTLAASTTYNFHGCLFTLNDGSNEGVKVALTGTVGVSRIKAQIDIVDDTTNVFGTTARVTALDSAVGVTALTGSNVVYIRGSITTSTAGTFIVQFAQNAAGTNQGVHLQTCSSLSCFPK